MGLAFGRLVDINEVAEFKHVPLIYDASSLPKPPEEREQTNKYWFIAMGLCILLLLPFLIYTLAYSVSRTLFYGVDDCGNVCGYSNSEIAGIACSGKNHTDKPYLHEYFVSTYQVFVKECVRTCPEFKMHGFYCTSSSFSDTDAISELIHVIKKSLETLETEWCRFVVSLSITIALSLFTLCLYRLATAAVVWTTLILSLIALIALAILFWLLYWILAPDIIFMGIAIFFSLFSIGALILTAALFKKIKLVIALFREATTTIFAMPGLLLVPIISAWSQVAVLILCFTTSVLMVSSGTLTEISENKYEYQNNFAMAFAIIFNIFISFWVLQFFAGCQYMAIAGSVSNWFFTRNKHQLDSPIIRSVLTTFKYHLGSISLGSFVLTIVAAIKAVVKFFLSKKRGRCLFACCINQLEMLIKLLSKNAYIEVAIHGHPFFKSGKRAAQLLIANAKSMVAINSIGDFVLGMTQLFLILLGSMFSEMIFLGTDRPHWFFVLLVVFNIITVSTIFGVFKTTVDSLFICFCEDKVLNDGVTKPFYMTRKLMQFVETSKKQSEKK